MTKFTIEGRLAGFNEYICACRSNAYKGAAMKKAQEKIVCAYIREQLSSDNIDGAVKLAFSWYEKDGRRDPDNICGFGHKVIMDALVTCGVLKDDSSQYIKGFQDNFHIDRKHPRVEVEITEIE